MKKIKTAFSMLLLLAILTMPASQAFASDNGILIRYTLGSDKITVNGNTVKVERPFLSSGILMVPLDVLVQAFGAELNLKDQGNINLLYRNTSLDMYVDSSKCVLNQNERYMAVGPSVKNNVIMVPFRFIAEAFGAKVSFNSISNTVTVELEDDGALTDLSFLTNSIGKSRVGNSYYGWSINVPKSSRIVNNTFNSKYVSIQNYYRGIYLEISVEANETDSLSSYYSKVLENPSDYIDTDIITDSLLYTKNGSGYAEFTYSNSNDEAVVQRIYINSQYAYHVMLSSYNETNPLKIKEDPYYVSMLDSFSLGYKGSQKDVQDLSKVEFGLAKYENYAEFDNGSKYFTWEISVPPEWDEIKKSNSTPLSATLGNQNYEYVSVETVNVKSAGDLKQYTDNLIKRYNDNFNPALYKFISSSATQIAGYDANKLLFSLKLGDSVYMVDENLLVSGNILYDITVKSRENMYRTNAEQYDKMLQTFKPTGKDTENLEKDIDSYNYQVEKNRIGKNEELTLYQNKLYKWSVKLPGNWLRDSVSNDYITYFDDSNTNFSITVEATENSALPASSPIEERFRILGNINSVEDITFVNKTTLSGKGASITKFNYRWENEDEEQYADIAIYTLTRDKNSYCILMLMPDLFKSSKNVKMMNDIWDSFTISN